MFISGCGRHAICAKRAKIWFRFRLKFGGLALGLYKVGQKPDCAWELITVRFLAHPVDTQFRLADVRRRIVRCFKEVVDFVRSKVSNADSGRLADTPVHPVVTRNTHLLCPAWECPRYYSWSRRSRRTAGGRNTRTRRPICRRWCCRASTWRSPSPLGPTTRRCCGLETDRDRNCNL